MKFHSFIIIIFLYCSLSFLHYIHLIRHFRDTVIFTIHNLCAETLAESYVCWTSVCVPLSNWFFWIISENEAIISHFHVQYNIHSRIIVVVGVVVHFDSIIFQIIKMFSIQCILCILLLYRIKWCYIVYECKCNFKRSIVAMCGVMFNMYHEYV